MERDLKGVWRSLVKRCQNSRGLIGYEFSENKFNDFKSFNDWAICQYGYNKVDKNGRAWVLDKDIIVLDNYNYGPDTCCFVPTEINLLVAYRNSHRKNYSDLPIGSAESKADKFKAVFNSKHLGTFLTAEEAHFCWCDAKVAKINDVVTQNIHRLPERTLQGLRGHANFIQSYRDRGIVLPRLKGAKDMSIQITIDEVVDDLVEKAHVQLLSKGLTNQFEKDLYLKTIKECFYDIYKS